jgi:hypothetical protein
MMCAAQGGLSRVADAAPALLDPRCRQLPLHPQLLRPLIFIFSIANALAHCHLVATNRGYNMATRPEVLPNKVRLVLAACTRLAPVMHFARKSWRGC